MCIAIVTVIPCIIRTTSCLYTSLQFVKFVFSCLPSLWKPLLHCIVYSTYGHHHVSACALYLRTKLPRPPASSYRPRPSCRYIIRDLNMQKAITTCSIMKIALASSLFAVLCLLQGLCVSGRSFLKKEPFQSWKAPAGTYL